MNKKFFICLRSRFTLLITLLVSSPIINAQVVSPVAPIWKWGEWTPVQPNRTHVYDSFGAAANAVIQQEAAGAANSGWVVKWQPRVNFFYPPDSDYEQHCHNCGLYTHQMDFTSGYMTYELRNVPGQRYEYTVPHNHHMSNVPICPAGYSSVYTNNSSLPMWERYRCVAQSNVQIPEKNPKNCSTEGLIGNPVNISLKAKFHSETDYKASEVSQLQFARIYSSAGMPRRNLVIGANWSHTYDRKINLFNNGTYQTAYVDRHDGRGFLFTLQSGVWRADSDINHSLIRLVDGSGNPAGWQYFNASNNETEEYDVAGKLIKITASNGRFQTLAYSDINTPPSIAPVPDLLIEVTDHFGRTLQFEYNEARLIKKMINSSGGVHLYSYDSPGRLISITHPDTTSRTYHYEVNSPSSCVNALTGITDESGIRFSTYGYDSECRVTSTQHSGGVNNYTVTYGTNTATVQDPLSISRTYNFSTVLGVTKNTSISEPCATCGGSSVQTRTYDSNGNVSQKTDFNGNITQYQYNSRNLETSRTEAYGTSNARTITTSWHSTLTLPTQIVEPGRTIAFTYDANGNKLTETVTDTTVTPNVSRIKTWTYNSDGQVLTVDGPRADVTDVTTYEYDSEGNVASITNALNQETQFTSYDDHGNPLTMIDPNNVTTTMTYDARQRLLTRTVASGTLAAATTTFEYWPTGHLKKIIQPDGSFLLYTYDNAQRLIKTEDNLGNYISYTLDNAGNRTEEKVYDPANVLVKTQSSVFDNLNRLIETIGASAQSTEYTYDDNGNLTGVTDPNNYTTTHSFDALNRLIQTVDPQNGATNPTEYTYDSRDNLTSVEDPRGLVTQYQYNGFNEVIQRTSPDTGVTTYTYDSAGNKTSQTDANSATINYSYDALNRLTSVDSPGTADDISYTYDACTNGAGRLCSVTRGNVVISYTYDVYGNIANVDQDIGTVSVDIDYAYNDDLQLESVTYPSGVEVEYAYDSAGRISSLTLDEGLTSTTLVNGITYQPFGPVNGYAQGNGITVSFDYDLDSRIQAITGDNILERDYVYDPAGNIELIDDAILNALDRSYSYDTINRLSLEEDLTGATTLFDYAYDPVGNRTLYDDTVTSQTLTYGTTNNRLTAIGAQPVTSDNNGNITSIHGMTLAYDAHNRLSSAIVGSTTTNYAYNGLGERVTKTTGSNTRHYFYGAERQLLAEYDASGNVEREYAYFEGQPVVMLDHSGLGTDIYWIHNDHLGRPLALTDEAGAVVWRLTNADAFGYAVIIDEDPDNNSVDLTFNLRFPGQYFDQETGLSYNYHRYYDPATDRYITSDPIGLHGGLNTYIYAMANPLRFTDPEGLQTAPTVPTPFPGLPIILPPVVIPGTPENQAWVEMVNDAIDAMKNISLGPWPGSSTRDDPDRAGKEAADEVKDEGGCPPDSKDPNKCKEAARKCKQKCIDRAAGGYGGSMSEWIGRCQLSCTSSLGCGNYFP